MANNTCFIKLGKEMFPNNDKYFPQTNTDITNDHDNEIFNISKINKEFTQHINMYIVYDTNYSHQDQSYFKNKHFINKKMIEIIVVLYKKFIEKYNFSGTAQIIPQNRYASYGPLEIYMQNNLVKSDYVVHTESTEFLSKDGSQINDYMDSAISYHLFDKNNILRSYLSSLNHSAKNLIMDMHNSEGFSYNVSIIFSDNFDQYNKYIFSIINEMASITTISRDFTYGYIIRCDEFVNFIIVAQRDSEKYYSGAININDLNKFAINFNIFFEKLLYNIYKKINIKL